MTFAARDDVEHGKPDPEIYQLVARELDVPPAECLVIEDSPSGVKAALAAGMWCIAVATPFTRQKLYAGDKIKQAFDKNPDLTNLLLAPYFGEQIESAQAAWRRVVAKAVEMGIPVPATSSALAFYDGYRHERLPANLLQAQRDYFGAHTYERVDKPRGEFFHTNWTGQGGDVTSGSYQA